MSHAKLERIYEFEGAHYLPHVPAGHKCGEVHGHSYKVIVTVRGKVKKSGPETGMVMDFAKIDEVVKPIIAKLDHSTLNSHAGLENPTSEVLCEWMINKILHSIEGLHAVEARETSRSSCIVYVDEVEHASLDV